MFFPEYPLNFAVFYNLVIEENKNNTDLYFVEILLNKEDIELNKGQASRYKNGETNLSRCRKDILNYASEYTDNSKHTLLYHMIKELDLPNPSKNATCLTALLKNGILSIDENHKEELLRKIKENEYDDYDIISLFYEYAVRYGPKSKLSESDLNNLKTLRVNYDIICKHYVHGSQKLAYDHIIDSIKRDNYFNYGVLLIISLYTLEKETNKLSLDELINYISELKKRIPQIVNYPLEDPEEIVDHLYHLAYNNTIYINHNKEAELDYSILLEKDCVASIGDANLIEKELIEYCDMWP